MKKENNPAPDPMVTFWQTQMIQAAQTPWLAALALKRARRLQERLAYFYQKLTSMPRRWRRHIQRSLAAGMVGAALLLAWGPTPSVHAATITVTPGAAGINSTDGCSIVEAIINANNDSQVGSTECYNGGGADTITLAGNTYSYTAAFGTDSALPDITSEIIIEANGATIERASGTFRIIRVNNSGGLTLNEATIRGGRLTAAYDYGGGLAVFSGGTLTINDSTISGNNANDGGGGIYNRGTTTINDSTISNNDTDASYYGGGGVFTYQGTTTINNSTISGNDANDSTGGGGVFAYRGTTTINDSTISRNYARYSGGGVYFSSAVGGSMTINDSTISGNDTRSGGSGGGVHSSGGTTTINDSTISRNDTHSGGNGGGIYHATGTLNLNRSLISGNDASSGREVYRSGGTINAASYNLFGDADAGQTNAQAFYDFTPSGTDITANSDGTSPRALSQILSFTLADNGGTTQTHALVQGSPAFDVIATTNANCNPGASDDQRNASRANGDGNGGAACDVGAYELQLTCTELSPTAVTVLAITALGERVNPIGLVGLVGLLAFLSGVAVERFRYWRQRG